MEDTSGFYKREGDELLYGRIIFGPTYTLIDVDHDSYEYPVDGWAWFNSREDAESALLGVGV